MSPTAPALTLILLVTPRWFDVDVVVFRHHPGLLDTGERMAAVAVVLAIPLDMLRIERENRYFKNLTLRPPAD